MTTLALSLSETIIEVSILSERASSGSMLISPLMESLGDVILEIISILSLLVWNAASSRMLRRIFAAGATEKYV